MLSEAYCKSAAIREGYLVGCNFLLLTVDTDDGASRVAACGVNLQVPLPVATLRERWKAFPGGEGEEIESAERLEFNKRGHRPD